MASTRVPKRWAISITPGHERARAHHQREPASRERGRELRFALSLHRQRKDYTLPIGYADGYNRALSSRAQVIYNGQLCNRVGNICMDQCMFEIDMRSRGTRPRLDPKLATRCCLWVLRVARASQSTTWRNKSEPFRMSCAARSACACLRFTRAKEGEGAMVIVNSHFATVQAKEGEDSAQLLADIERR